MIVFIPFILGIGLTQASTTQSKGKIVYDTDTGYNEIDLYIKIDNKQLTYRERHNKYNAYNINYIMLLGSDNNN